MIQFKGKFYELELLYKSLNYNWGLHTIIDLCDCCPDKIKSEEVIRVYVYALCNTIGATKFGDTVIVNFGENEDVEGFSMTQLIETSLLSGHFVNKTNRVFMDIFSCNLYDPESVISLTKEAFEGQVNDYKVLVRN